VSPYIPREHRISHTPTSSLAAPTSGVLNFQITELLKEYVRHHGTSYDTLNAVVGALGCVKAEFYRRVVAPYEDLKRAENGDVYP